MVVQPKREEGTEELSSLRVKVIHWCDTWVTKYQEYTLLFKASDVLSSHNFGFNFLDAQQTRVVLPVLL